MWAANINLLGQCFIYAIKSLCSFITVEEGTKVFIVATIAWGLRKCSRAIMLALIFLIAMKPGFIHAVYSEFLLGKDIKVSNMLL